MRYLLLFLLIISTVLSCSDENPVNTKSNTGTVIINSIFAPEKVAKPAELKPTTSAIISFYDSKDELLVEKSLTVTGNRISGSVTVKAGSGYSAELFCYDYSNNITHSGTASNINIVAGQQTTITILLMPAIPEAPTVVGPSTTITSGTEFTITWSEVSRAKSYTIEEDTGSNFTNPDSETVVGLSNSETKITDTAIAFYYRIKANNSSGSSNWSNVIVVTFESVTTVQYMLTMAVNQSGWGTTTPAVGPYSYDENSVVVITATPAEGYRFVNWTGDVADSGNATTTVTLTGDKTVTAVFEEEPETKYTLTLAVNNSAWGETFPAVGGNQYIDGTTVSITAVPADGYRFVSWSGVVADATSATTTVTVTANSTVTAIFEKLPIGKYSLTMMVNQPGWGTTDPPPGASIHDDGSIVTITATPASGYRFVNWTGTVADASSATTTVKLNANVTVTANFEVISVPQFILTMAVNQSGWGTTNPSVGSHAYDEGKEVTITATPSEGYQFVDWTGDVADANSSTTTVTMSGDKNVTANFEEISEYPTEITMVSISAGSFSMGSNDGEEDEKPVHTVALNYSFEMSATEITQGQYKSVIGTNPSHSFGVGDYYPVYNVHWHDAVTFCNKLSDSAGLERCYNESTGACDFTKNGFRLPTEAEWEYACRAGTTTAYYTGDSESDLARAGWYDVNSSNVAHPVGQKTPNAWGLYDMHGNEWEWCNDWYGSYSSESATNPTGAQTGSTRVFRGGGWGNNGGSSRSASRNSNPPYAGNVGIGFRVVRGAHQVTPVQYTLTMAVNTVGWGTVNPSAGSHTYDENSVVTVTATPASGYRFVNWTGSVADTGIQTTTVTVTGNMTVTANFEKIPSVQYTLTMAVNQSGWGTTTPAVGTHSYDYGTEVTIVATPESGYRFVKWIGLVADTENATTKVTITKNTTVTATFEVIPQTSEISMLSIPAGSFEMGSNSGDTREKPVHPVILDAFEMSATEITQGQYKEIIGSNPSSFIGSDDLPVEAVTWFDAARFCNRLSDDAGLERCYNEYTWECDFSKNGYRLPTEAEWEYACRAGTETLYYTGDNKSDLSQAGWFSENSDDKTHIAGDKMPNAWGLYDMHGNVSEWCNDWYDRDYYSSSPLSNPSGPASGSGRVFRGGSWMYTDWYCRSSYRGNFEPTVNNILLGFRVVRRSFTPIEIQHTLTIGVNQSGWGTTSPSVGTHTYDEGTEVTITATPASGYRFVNWTGDVADPNSPSTTVTMTGDKSVTANFEEITEPIIEITMVFIPAVTTPYEMESGYTVTLSAYEMSATEVTNAQYAEYLNSALASEDIEVKSGDVYGKTGDWSGEKYLDIGYEYNTNNKCWINFSDGTFSVTSGYENWPVVAVTWYGSKAFAEYYGLDLPTEAEWQYAASGGRNYEYGTDDGTISSNNANYNGNVGHPTDAGSYPTNPFGLYDMSGNVWEWCSDWYGSYPSGSVSNPTGAQTVRRRVRRGGSWGASAGVCQSAYRGSLYPDSRYYYVGFRVVSRPGGVTY